MSQRNRSTRSQRALNQSPRPTTSQRARRDSSPIYSELHNPSEQSQDDLRENEKKMFVAASCKYILGMTKRKLPIKCADLVKICMQGENRLFAEIFEVVSNQLSQVSCYPITYQFILFIVNFLLHSCTVWKREKLKTINWAKLFCVFRLFRLVPNWNLRNTNASTWNCCSLCCRTFRWKAIPSPRQHSLVFSNVWVSRMNRMNDSAISRRKSPKHSPANCIWNEKKFKLKAMQKIGKCHRLLFGHGWHRNGSNGSSFFSFFFRIQYTWGRRAQLEVSPEKVTEAVAKVWWQLLDFGVLTNSWENIFLQIFQVPSSVFQAQHNNESDEENDEGLETSDIEMNGNWVRIKSAGKTSNVINRHYD